MKPNLGLGGVYINIHPIWAHFKVQHKGGVSFQMENISIGLSKCVCDQPVTHKTSINKEVLGIA